VTGRPRKDSETIRHQVEILQIAEGFFQSGILFALLKLRVFEKIGEGAKSGPDLAALAGVPVEPLTRLLNAAVGLKILETPDGSTYRLTEAGRAVLLPQAGENYLGDWILNLDYFRLAMASLDEAVRTARPTVDPGAHLGSDEDATREFTMAMHDYASLRGKELTRYLDTSECRSLLDLGCGPGTYAFHLGLENPGLEIYLLDLPGVLEVAREVRKRYPLKNEIRYLPADALKDPIPGSYDLVLVSNTLHMLGEEASKELIRRAHASINPGGSLVIQAQFLRDDRLGPRWPLLLDLIQLCITEKGRNHTASETREWMEAAGFRRIEHCPMTLLNTNSFLRGYKKEV
jgi:SAM-dependent methyltransferase